MPLSSRTRGRIAVLVALAAAFVANAAWVLVTARGHSEPAFQVWAACVIVMQVVNVVVFGVGWGVWSQLDQPIGRWTSVASAVAFVALVVAGVIVFLSVVGAGPDHGTALVGAALLAGVPALASFASINRIVWRPALVRSVETQVRTLMKLAELSRRLLAAGGSLVALTTTSLGAAVILQHDRAAHGDLAGPRYPAQAVIVFGVVGSATLAAVYLPSAIGLRVQARQLAEIVFVLPPGHSEVSPDGEALIRALRGRAELIDVIGVGHAMWSDFQSGVVILAPLFAAAAASFLTPT